MKCGLLGEKLGHSYSPEIHAELVGEKYEYLLYEKKADEVADFINNGKWDRLNVTIPYKKVVMQFCDEISKKAQEIGSVNTLIRRQDGTLYGDNTDWRGFLRMVEKAGLNWEWRKQENCSAESVCAECSTADMQVECGAIKVLVLGSGGTSVMVQAVFRDICIDGKMPEVIVVSRNGENNYSNLDKHADAEIIVNSTPVGMYPNNFNSPVDLDMFPNCKAVLDIVANPLKTELALEAEARGITAVGGLLMLVEQARVASELFMGESIEPSETDRVLDAIVAMKQNIVLIGMPGSGKSSVGRRLEAELGWKFVDTDEVIKKQNGMSPGEIISELGEAEFRKCETQALADVAKKNGQIIATGGGIVTVPENLDIIRQNSVTVFLYRDIDKLPTDGRPLSKSRSPEVLWEQRKDLYYEWSDFVVENVEGNDSIEKTAQAVLEKIGI